MQTQKGADSSKSPCRGQNSPSCLRPCLRRKVPGEISRSQASRCSPKLMLTFGLIRRAPCLPRKVPRAARINTDNPFIAWSDAATARLFGGDVIAATGFRPVQFARIRIEDQRISGASSIVNHTFQLPSKTAAPDNYVDMNLAAPI